MMIASFASCSCGTKYPRHGWNGSSVESRPAAEDDPDPVRDPIVDEGNRRRIRQHVVERGLEDAPTMVSGVRDVNHVLRSLKLPHNPVVRPGRRNARVDAEGAASSPEPEDALETRPIHPRRGPRV